MLPQASESEIKTHIFTPIKGGIADTDESLVSSRFSREIEVSVSVSISYKGFPESQSQSRSRVSNLALTDDTFPNLLLSKNLEKFEISRKFESLSLDLDLV